MKKLIFLLLLTSAVFLAGCRKKQEKYIPPSRIVTGVDIYCQKADGTVHRHYTDPAKVEAVLYYVRLLDPYGPTTVTAEAMQGDLYEIVIRLQDGGVRIHRQRADTFAALHRRYWGLINPSMGMRLPYLMALLPSDEVDANNIDIPKKTLPTS